MNTHIWKRKRPLTDVPPLVMILLAFAIIVQLLWHGQQPMPIVRAVDLPSPLSAQAYTVISLGEPLAAARVLNLWLQSYDKQPGISLSFKQLDYARIALWLDVILELDPPGRYPLLVAARVYGSVNDEKRKRYMMNYVFDKFNQAPDQRWPWLAHAVIVAKHELKDLPLALKYAEALSEKATGKNVPYWARDMKIIVLEDMGEIEAAKILVGGLLQSGEIVDEYELTFLANKIRQLEESASKRQQNVE